MRTIRQHYVPRFYLKQFATEIRTNTFLVHGFDLNTGRIFEQTIDNVALETKGYDLDIDDELLDIDLKNEAFDNLSPEIKNKFSSDEKKKMFSSKIYASIEDGLGEAEGSMATALRALIHHQSVFALSQEERKQISLFIGSQYIRTRKMRTQYYEMSKKVINRINQIYPNGKKNPEYDEKKLKLAWLMGMEKGTYEFASIIHKMQWSLLVAKFGAEIHTNDNPVLLYNPTAAKSPYGNMGLVQRDIQIYLPLTPYMVLNLNWNPLLRNKETIYFDHKSALFMKSLLVEFAERMLFARGKDVFDVRPEMKRNIAYFEIN